LMPTLCRIQFLFQTHHGACVWRQIFRFLITPVRADRFLALANPPSLR
jgi:hypothetical protein